jgi:hypothetical protein
MKLRWESNWRTDFGAATPQPKKNVLKPIRVGPSGLAEKIVLLFDPALTNGAKS